MVGVTLNNVQWNNGNNVKNFALGRNNENLKLLRYKILIFLITGMLDSFIQRFLDLYTTVRSCMQPSKIAYSRLKLVIAVFNRIKAETS